MSRQVAAPLVRFDWARFRTDIRTFITRQGMTGVAFGRECGFSSTASVNQWIWGRNPTTTIESVLSMAWVADLDLADYTLTPDLTAVG